MKAKCRRDQINQRRFIADLTLAKQFCGRDMASAAMGFDAAPVIDALENVLAIFADLQFDHRQTPVVTQRQQVDRARASWTAMRRPKLRMQRSDDQTGI